MIMKDNCLKTMLYNINENHKKNVKIREEEEMWRIFGGSSFNLLPPRFRVKHTPEEAERKKQETIARLYAMIDEYNERIRQEEKEKKLKEK